MQGDASRAVARVPTGKPAVYRGWMLRYAGFATALADRGVELRTSADQYRRGHELPGWYSALRAFTPASAWTTGSDRQAYATPSWAPAPRSGATAAKSLIGILER